MNRARPLSCLLVAIALLLAGCVSIPDTYAPPIQRNPQYGPPDSRAAHFVSMSGPNPDDHIVRDVLPGDPGSPWRWTGKRPELWFNLQFTDNLRFVMDFSVPESTFPQRGPVTISFFINGRLLDSVRCAKHGEVHFEKAVPAAWLRTDAPTFVAAEIDKVWVAPADRAQLGFVLSRAGFVQ